MELDNNPPSDHTPGTTTGPANGSAGNGRGFRRGLVAGGIGLAVAITATAAMAGALTGTPAPATNAVLGDATQAEVSTQVSTVVLDQDGDGDSDTYDEAWVAFETCLVDTLAEAGYDTELLENLDDLGDDDLLETLDDEQLWADLDAADATCREQLPADIKAEIEAEEQAWSEWEACVDAAVGDTEGDDWSGVWVEGEEESMVVFGGEPGSVTISGTAGNLTVDGDGVQILTGDAIEDFHTELDDAWDEATAHCDDLAPEDYFDDDYFDDDYDDEYDDDYFDDEYDDEDDDDSDEDEDDDEGVEDED
jgi:hypothetical protein